jgi:hypothetical protein
MKAGKETQTYQNPKKPKREANLSAQTKLNKGALILLAPNATSSTASTKNLAFSFQYNPDKLVHAFTPASQLASTSLSLSGAPSEVFNLTFELDNVDFDLSDPNQNFSLGLHPVLAMLELMVQPQTVGSQTTLPYVVFCWGTNRSVLVHIVSLNVEETSFDGLLNPTRANVTLCLKVLTAAEIKDNPAALDVYTSHQNMHATLVDAYKHQTGQVPAQLTGKATVATTAALAASLTTAKANTVKATTTKTQTTTTTTNTQTKK